MTKDARPAAKAQELLGAADESNDWKLDPHSHAAKLDPRAGALKRVLEHSAIVGIMDRYTRADEKANAYQAAYKGLGKWDIYLVANAAVLGAIVLSITDSANTTPMVDGIRKLLLFVQILSAAGVVGIKYYLERTGPFVHWQKQRSVAETARIELFETVAGMTGQSWDSTEKPGDYPLLPLQLEYFVRYQLNVQLRYYDGRGKEHAAAAKRLVSAGAIITFVAALGAASAGAASQLGDGVSLASVIALLAPILLSAQTNLSRLNQDERNAARYAITYDHLRKRASKLTDVRESAGSGDVTIVHEFIRVADEVISIEHSQWITQQSEGSDSATPS